MAGVGARAFSAIGACVLVAVAALAHGEDSGENNECGGSVACCAVGSAQTWKAHALIMAGPSVAELQCGGDKGFDHVDFSTDGTDRGNDHVNFRITIQPEGRVDVNGQEFAACDPADGCRLSLAWSSGASTLVVQVEQADGSLAAGQFYLAEAPTEISVKAAEIRLLSITPQ